jgi:hypothetical protein
LSTAYVQYGCGFSPPEAWTNFDASPTLRFERIPLVGKVYTKNASRFPKNVRYGDIVKGLPVEPNSCRGVYCSHILEHLAYDDFLTALKNTKEILMQDGIFRLVVPDLRYFANCYVSDVSAEAAETFMLATGLGLRSRPKNLVEQIKLWLSNGQHLWMWDSIGLSRELASAGFRSIRSAQFGDCPDPHFRLVEDVDRWANCVGIECRRKAMVSAA